MTARSFVDSNILVYTDATDAPEKRQIALALIERLRRDRRGALSIQVLQEYFAATTRKLRVDPTLARRKVELFSQLDVVQPSVEDVLAAIDLHRLHQLSFWDALIIQAAAQARCAVLLTEDMQHGQRIGAVQVINPFLPSADT